MKEQRIVIQIDEEGRISADADGFTGDTCLRDLERLLENLAPGSAKMDRKPDSNKAQVSKARAQSVGKKT